VSDFASGQVRLIPRDQAAAAFPAIYSAYRPTRAGELERTDIDFINALGEPGGEELNRRFYVVYEEAGHLDAYVSYEVVPMEPPAHGPRRIVMHELCALTPGSYVAMWDFVLGVDLTVELLARSRPVDEPIKWLLAEPRQLRCTFSGDHLWIRLVDVAKCLATRCYAAAGDLVVELVDDFCPWNSGRYRLVVGDDWGSAEVTMTEGDADVELDASTLASIYLGGVSPQAFADVGRLRQRSAGSVATMARMFANDRPPYCLTHF
jgi:predicted acetyltransferase